jgi:predicted NBD/HSP70 family sugar kinase
MAEDGRYRPDMANKINEINISRVLQKLWFSKGISRVDISRELGLGKSTVTKIMTMLLNRNLVKIVTSGPSGPSGGRRPLRLAINSEYGCVLGLEIQTETFTAVATNLLGEIVFSHSQPITVPQSDIVSIFLWAMGELRQKIRESGLPLIGIGVGVAGIIDPYQGVIVQSNPLDIKERVHFYGQIEGKIDVPVLIENDAKCCCWGELAFKKTARHGNFVFVLGEFRKGRTIGSDYWGPAIGLGFVLNGKVYYGEDFSSGEFQSILWREGNRGQFSFADEEAKLIKENEPIRLSMLRELSSHIAYLVNTLNLAGVVIGGEISTYKEELRDILQSEIQKNWSYANKVECSVEFAFHGSMAVAFGAAGMFLEHLFSIPDVVDGGRTPSARIGALLRAKS